MNLSSQEINSQFLMLSEQEQQKVIDFILAYVKQRLGQINDTASLSEADIEQGE